jgi:tRNA A37 methylthiotransferase MiaB
VIDVHRSLQLQINRGELGSVLEVLVEREARSPGDVLGRTATNKVVAFQGGDELIGCYRDVRLTATTGATFSGEAV